MDTKDLFLVKREAFLNSVELLRTYYKSIYLLYEEAQQSQEVNLENLKHLEDHAQTIAALINNLENSIVTADSEDNKYTH